MNDEKPALTRDDSSKRGRSERAQKEEKILQFWKENKIFEKTLEKEAPKGEFVFYDGPPFATGLPHYGHILPGTIKDVIPRYKTMRGYKVPRKWGWDCHGLPIENLIEKELGLQTKKDILNYGIAEFNKKARESVLRYEKDWKEIIPRTGRWIDMENSYKTMDSSYTESVWWSFSNLYGKNLVYQGFKSMHLCPRCETTLSNFEVNLGYKDITDISVYVKFELSDTPGTYLVAWTTTPWTLPGNVALAVNPAVQYAEVKTGSGMLILAEDRLSVLKDLSYEKVRSFSGSELVGKKYKTIFDYYLNEGKVYVGEFVKAEEGTGIVHIAPAFGEEDYELSLKEKLPFVQHVGTDGRFKPEVKDFAGMQVKPKDDHQATDIEIIKNLAHRGILLAKEKIVHSYPHCWRCDTPLLNYAASSWFVKVAQIKDRILESNNKVGWLPKEIKDGRFGKWLEGARDWAVSRSRYWGTPLPVWQNNDGSKRIVIDSVATLKKYCKPSSNEYLIMRHGGTESNLKELVSYKNEANDHLTKSGREVALTSAQNLKNQGVELIVTSTFARARETAEIVRAELGLPESAVVADERLREVNPGKFDGKNWGEYHDYLYHAVGNNWFEGVIPEGESLREVGKRVGECLYELEQKYKGKKILIVTHGGPAWLSFVISGLYKPDNKAYHRAGSHIFVEEFKRFSNSEVRTLPFAPLPHNEYYELDLHRPYIDEVVLEKEGEEYRRVPEVFDTWYDSGSVPFASRGAINSVPADFIAEGLDQTRGWFYTMIVLGTALFGLSPYKQVVVNGLVLAEDGKKMSKRLKNYPELTEVLDKYGADALRYYLMSSPAVRAEDIAFSEKGLEEIMKKNISRLENVLEFYELYSSKTPLVSSSENHVLDQWIELRLANLTESITEALEKYEIDRASRPLAEFIDDLSTWYLRRSRTRPEALPKLREILLNFSKLMAPFMPFMAEDIYQRLKEKGNKESVHLEVWPTAERTFLQKFLPNKENSLLKDMKRVREIVSMALELRSKANIKVRQPLLKLELKTFLPTDYLNIIREELNVKGVVINPNLEEEIKLDTQLTPELIEEGKVRDAIRAIQEWRKEQGLKPGEKAHFPVPETESEFYQKHKEELKKAANIEL